ncbi:MAG: hypothetical protein ACFHXK_02020 [bacterium]
MQIDGPANIPAEEDGSTIDLDALRAEVAKWQERVPKLAKALRERTEELAAAREELRSAQTAPTTDHSPAEDTDARLQTRNALIKELQEKVDQLGEKHRQLSGTLHTTQLDLDSAREDAQNWQQKWQEVTASLDETAELASRSNSELERARQAWEQEKEATTQAHNEAMQQLQRETESLRVRNANLGETIEFANKQIESLGEDMQLLMDRGKTADATIAQSQAAQAELQAQMEALSTTNSTLQNQLTDLQGQLDDAQKSLQQQNDEAQETVARTHQQLEEAQHALSEAQAHYRSAMQAANEEQTQLVNQLDKKDQQIEGLNKQLDDGLALAQKQRSAQQDLEAKLQALQQTLENNNVRFETQLAAEKTALSETQTALSEAQTALSDSATALGESNAKIADLQAAQEALEKEHENLLQQSTQDATELTALREDQARWIAMEQDLLAQVNAVADAGVSKQKELDEEIARLSQCVTQAQDSHAEREAERRQLTTRLQELTEENEKLKDSLEERSALVRELENEREAQRQSQHSSTAALAEQAQRATELERKVTTFQEHAQNLEAKLQTQQGLMGELESELSEARSEHSQALKEAEQKFRQEKVERSALAEKLTALQHRSDDLERHNHELAAAAQTHKQALKAAEEELHREREARQNQQRAVSDLQAEVEKLQAQASAMTPEKQDRLKDSATRQTRELEQLLRERTEELDKLRWKLEQPVENDDKLVMILNQQLDDARQENKRLREKAAALNAGEELTRIKGIGEKLAQQLQEFGVTTVAQVAALNVAALDDENHPLHALQSRIVRDEWIEQAEALLK